MRLLADQLQLSASDLAAHLGCAHRTHLDHRAARGELTRPPPDPLLEGSSTAAKPIRRPTSPTSRLGGACAASTSAAFKPTRPAWSAPAAPWPKAPLGDRLTWPTSVGSPSAPRAAGSTSRTATHAGLRPSRPLTPAEPQKDAVDTFKGRGCPRTTSAAGVLLGRRVPLAPWPRSRGEAKTCSRIDGDPRTLRCCGGPTACESLGTPSALDRARSGDKRPCEALVARTGQRKPDQVGLKRE